MQLIGIDIGTTGICGVLTDALTGEVLQSYTENSEAFIQTENAWERIQSVDRILTVTMGILDKLFTDKVAAIGITGQMHGILYFDKNGISVSPLYTWQDARSGLAFGEGSYASHVGAPVGYGCATDFYNRVNGLVPQEAVGFCTVYDYLAMRLTGRKTPLLHVSTAASLGCFDICKQMFTNGVDLDVTDGYALAGEYRGVPVSVGIGDNQASVFSTLSSEGDVLLNFGTGSQVSVVSDTPVFADGVEARPYFDGKYLLVGAALCGGRAYAMLKSFYKGVLSYQGEIADGDVYAIMGKMAEAGKDALTVDTRFSGTRADSTVRGGVFGIGEENFTPEALTRGVLRGMVEELYALYEKMGIRAAGVIGSGNGIRKNAALVRAAEERFESKMRIPAHTEEAAVGAALYGGIAARVYPDAQAVRGLIQYL